ncbi:MAG TPA: TIR domain-containing protein [Solirubrobacteraceae bacterium]
MADVFLSYSRLDGAFVRRLLSALQARGKDVWVDVDGIRDGEVFPEALRRAIESSDAFVFVISPDSVHSSFCEEEVEHAAHLNKRIVPLSLRPVPDEELREEVRFRNWIPASGDGDLDATVERLITALDTDLEWERQHSRLTVKALEWQQAGRDRSFLLRAAELRSAEGWLAVGVDKDPGPTALETEYLVAGRRFATRRQRRLVIGSVVVAAVSIALLTFALISRSDAVHQALTSDAERVGAQALTQKNLDLAMLYAVAGVKLQNRLQTRSDLVTVLQDSPAAIRLLRPSQNEITALAVSSAGRLLATGDSAGVVRFEEMSRWRPEGSPVRLPGAVMERGMAFAPHGGTLGVLSTTQSSPTPGGSSGSTDTNLYAVDTATGKVRRLLSLRKTIPLMPDPGAAFAFSPDGGRIALVLATAAPDGSIASATLRLLDASTGRVIWRRNYPLHPGQAAIRLQFAPDGTLLTSSQQGDTLLWNGRTGRRLRRLPFGGPLAVSSRGQTVAVAVNSPDITTASSRIAVVDRRTGHYRFLAAGVSSTWVKTLAITPNGKSIIGTTLHGDTYVWDTASGSISYTIASPVGAIGTAAVDPAVRTLLVGSRDGGVTAFDLSGSRRLGRAFQWGPPSQSCPSAPCFVVNHQSDLMATDQANGAVALIHLPTLRLAAKLPARNGPSAPAIAFFPNGRTLLTGGVAGRLTLWDTRSHRVLRTIKVGAPVAGADVSSDGRLIAVLTQGQGSRPPVVQVRPVAGGAPLWSGEVSDGATDVHFSPDGNEVAALGCCTALSTVVAWDARSGRQLFRRRSSDHATAIAFSPDSTVLGVGTENGQVLLWNARRGDAEQRPLHVATASIAAISFSPDGSQLAASSTDQSTTLWNLRSRTQVGNSFPSRPLVITVPVFERNGRLLIDYLADAADWPMKVGAWERFACRVAGRNLTQTEWHDILPNRPYMRVCPR